MAGISDFYHGRVIEVGVFAAEDVAEWITDKASFTAFQIIGLLSFLSSTKSVIQLDDTLDFIECFLRFCQLC